MLVLSRKIGERIHIGGSIVLTVVAIQGNRVRLGIEAPSAVDILREELCDFRDAGVMASTTSEKTRRYTKGAEQH